jgi:hypothetical protein
MMATTLLWTAQGLTLQQLVVEVEEHKEAQQMDAMVVQVVEAATEEHRVLVLRDRDSTVETQMTLITLVPEEEVLELLVPIQHQAPVLVVLEMPMLLLEIFLQQELIPAYLELLREEEEEDSILQVPELLVVLEVEVLEALEGILEGQEEQEQ